MKPHYFDEDSAPASDIQLTLCIQQGYVPPGCLLAGIVVWGLTMKGEDPCKGCEGPREKCGGRAK